MFLHFISQNSFHTIIHTLNRNPHCMCICVHGVLHSMRSIQNENLHPIDMLQMYRGFDAKQIILIQKLIKIELMLRLNRIM